MRSRHHARVDTDYEILSVNPFNIELTLCGGQSFAWDVVQDGWFVGGLQRGAIRLRLVDDFLHWQTYPDRADAHRVLSYLRLDAPVGGDLARSEATIRSCPHVCTAMNSLSRVLLLKQDFDETLLSYLCSPQNSVPSIRHRIRSLRTKFGQRIDVAGCSTTLFPETEVLASVTEESLRACGVGYRARSIARAARQLVVSPLSTSISQKSEADARRDLLDFWGIGDKIADCILLYGLAHDGVFPLDVWGMRIAHDLYGVERTARYEEIREHFRGRFNGLAGLAGQYLYEWMRSRRG